MHPAIASNLLKSIELTIHYPQKNPSERKQIRRDIKEGQIFFIELMKKPKDRIWEISN